MYTNKYIALSCVDMVPGGLKQKVKFNVRANSKCSVFSLTSYLSYVFPIHMVCFNSHGKTDRVNRPLVRVISMIQLYIYFYTLNLTFCFRPPIMKKVNKVIL
jgi:hypothetical protein